MTPERQEEIRATLEAEDPDFYWALGGYTKETAKSDYAVKWELLFALENAQEHIAKVGDEIVLALSTLRAMNGHRSGWGQEVYAILQRAYDTLPPVHLG